jgi:hypothetical protein
MKGDNKYDENFDNSNNDYFLRMKLEKLEEMIVKFDLISIDSGENYLGTKSFSDIFDSQLLKTALKSKFSIKTINSEEVLLVFPEILLDIKLSKVINSNLEKQMEILKIENNYLKKDLQIVKDEMSKMKSNFVGIVDSLSFKSSNTRLIAKTIEGTSDGGWSYKSSSYNSYVTIPGLFEEFDCKKAIIICTVNGHISYKGKSGHVISGFFLDGGDNKISEKMCDRWYYGLHYINTSSYGCFGPFSFTHTFKVDEGHHKVELKAFSMDQYTLNGCSIQLLIIEN